MIEADPTILGTPLLVPGRQVATDYGKFIDLLAVDDDGVLHVLELKRERTPREVVAQLLDYGSWVQSLGDQQVRDLYAQCNPGQAVEQAWSDVFGGPAPDELNHEHAHSGGQRRRRCHRAHRWLPGRHGRADQRCFLQVLLGRRAGLPRSHLAADEATTVVKKAAGRKGGSKEPWNEQDWYVSFGEESGVRDWDDARRYGFVSAGGGEWFSKTIRKLPEGARVFVCIPKTGYVGVGTVAGPAHPFEAAEVYVDGERRKLSELPLRGVYEHPPQPDGQDADEYVVPVAWTDTRSREQAVWSKGMFANQNSACKLRNHFTLEQLVAAFDLE